MRKRTIASEGIVIKTVNFKEADKIVTLLSPTLGKISLLAKSVRRIKSKKRSSLSLFSKIKFQAITGYSLPILTDTSIVRRNEYLENKLGKLTLAYYLVEVVDKIVPDGQVDSGIYKLLDSYLNLIDTQKNLKTVRKGFVREILENLGFIDNQDQDLDLVLSTVVEKRINSFSVGKKMLE